MKFAKSKLKIIKDRKVLKKENEDEIKRIHS